jgi:3'(2'), 5'-bisphosphate nucleotidase
MSELTDLLGPLKKIALKAGMAIMDIYKDESRFDVEQKSDDSPLTAADKKSNELICDGIELLAPKYPIISEENKEVEYEKRKSYNRYWLIDPLDGTKEFIKRNGEFTVNIALVEDQKTILGVVYAPVLEEMYWAIKSEGAFLENKGNIKKIQSRSIKLSDKNLRIVCSRSHLNDETQTYINQFTEPEKVSIGSSLKFLIIAKGEADIYPRLAPTMEWDTAAAQIILEEAGGKVLESESRLGLKYNKANLRNPHFIAFGAVD